jgi:hypothetical protein
MGRLSYSPLTWRRHSPITYVELEDDSLLLADNILAESFIDNLDCLAFDKWDKHGALGTTAPLVEMAYTRAKATR